MTRLTPGSISFNTESVPKDREDHNIISTASSGKYRLWSAQPAVTKHHDNRYFFLIALEAGRPRSRCSLGQVLVRNHFQVANS